MSCPLDIHSNVNPDAFDEIENVDPHNVYNMLMQPPPLSRSVESNSEDETPGIRLNDGPSQTRPLVRRENSTSHGNEDFFDFIHETTTPHMPPKKMPDTALESLSDNNPTSVTPVSSLEQGNSPVAPHPGNKSHNPTDGSFSSSQASVACTASETPKDANSNEEGSYPRSCLPSKTDWTSDGPLETSSYADRVLKDFINGNAFDDTSPDGSDTDYVDESAIDDEDDSSDCADSIEDSNKSSIDEKTFQRVDSKIHLRSRRSLITLMINGQSRRGRAGNLASQSTSALPPTRTSHSVSFDLAVSPNDSDDAALTMKRGDRSLSQKPITEVPPSVARPMPATASHSHLQAALTPRTTRRNMLATELTESLRRNLLWERQLKSSTANAVLKRRHTSHEVGSLKQYPEKASINENEDIPDPFQDFSKNYYGGYHSNGW
ncbi:hypothetical protein CLIM01_14652 [Colletotrichum limetticola]|uniref:DUF3295 domain-containing protein n=1 Tax=Colletotrichum limetticola TaxID=1209924 RepID=A0ABQ9P792_9PEZI|nr:hypothetical protein CLIM01_14652 [Colletotrichum limetticola]